MLRLGHAPFLSSHRSDASSLLVNALKPKDYISNTVVSTGQLLAKAKHSSVDASTIGRLRLVLRHLLNRILSTRTMELSSLQCTFHDRCVSSLSSPYLVMSTSFVDAPLASWRLPNRGSATFPRQLPPAPPPVRPCSFLSPTTPNPRNRATSQPLCYCPPPSRRVTVSADHAHPHPQPPGL